MQVKRLSEDPRLRESTPRFPPELHGRVKFLFIYAVAGFKWAIAELEALEAQVRRDKWDQIGE